MKFSRLRWLSAFAGLALLVAAGALIGIYVSEGGPSTGEQVQPLACREFERYKGELSGEKLDSLARRCEEAKAVAARGPIATAPVLTPTQETPAPLPPCEEWEPSTASGGCRVYGVAEGRQPPPGYERTYRVSNTWFGATVIVYAGSLYSDDGQGIVVVTDRESGSSLGEFRTEAKGGALRIVSADGNLLNLVAATGTEYTFKVDEMALTPK